MKNSILIIILLVLPFIGTSQELYTVQMDVYQTLQTPAAGNKIRLPMNNTTIVMGGLNDLDGLGNYFNIYGSKLIVDSLDTGTDGIKRVVLRREDGRNFLDLFPTITAKLIPLYRSGNNKENSINYKADE
ncbi:hypothetical protein [Costertonia aggregata]|uniref:Uncharacterized protein n=1 Tax=Costertonia aggregata TaxID=343403 RepID=A0A7H9AQA2_9FLAO|nr:hypothetical protein [Costertonia aggregata]QLG45661.1 hypothetical protein HYG79_09985 [Costertonia aggregata]